MHSQPHLSCALIVLSALTQSGCGGGSSNAATTTATTTSTTTTTAAAATTATTTSSPAGVDCKTVTVATDAVTQLPPGYSQLAALATVYRQGSFVVVQTQDIPNHKSPYFAVTDARYVAGPSGFAKNPSSIAAQNYVLKIPAQPTCASTTTDTALDAIGVATNGVVFFNQYAAGNMPLTNEILGFDQFNGHPAQQNNYHYHKEPVSLTATNSAALVGWALDGFPVYGPKNPDGSTPSLDKCNGQFSATPEFPSGIYHYHVTAVSPYLIGCYAGTPGTKSN